MTTATYVSTIHEKSYIVIASKAWGKEAFFSEARTSVGSLIASNPQEVQDRDEHEHDDGNGCERFHGLAVR